MATVGSGTIKLRNKYTSMEEVSMDILSLLNTPSIAQHRLDEIYGRNKRTGMDIEDLIDATSTEDYSFVEREEERAVTELLDPIRKSFILKNILGIISRIADKQDKIIDLIFLMSNTTFFTTNPEEFHLDENFETEYLYILNDNKRINEQLKMLHNEFMKSAELVAELEEQFRRSVDEEVADILLDYPPSALMETTTGNFYKVLRKQLGECFTKEQKEAVSEFLTSYRDLQRKLAQGSTKLYCERLGVPYNVYMNEKIRAKALEPIDQLSASGLLM